MSYDVVSSGYCSLDRVIRIDRSASIGRTSLVINHDNATIRFGGCNVNVAIDLTRLGVRALPIIRVGFDYETSGFKAYLRKENMDDAAIATIKEAATSACYLVENPAHDHMTLFYPGAMSKEHFQPYQSAWFEGAKIALMTVADLVDNREFAKQAKQHNIALFIGMKMDVSAFPPHFIQDLAQQLRGIFCNETENDYLKECLGVSTNLAMMETYRNIDFILTTKGKGGSEIYYRESDKIIHHKIGIVPANPYVDSVGSGDAYIAGFIYGRLNQYTYPQSMELGATLATYVIEGEGATTGAPTLSQLLRRHQEAFPVRKDNK